MYKSAKRWGKDMSFLWLGSIEIVSGWNFCFLRLKLENVCKPDLFLQTLMVFLTTGENVHFLTLAPKRGLSFPRQKMNLPDRGQLEIFTCPKALLQGQVYFESSPWSGKNCLVYVRYCSLLFYLYTFFL